MHGVEPEAGSLVSGEGVRLTLSSAGVGSRTVAATVDAALQFAALVVLLLLTQLIGTTDDAALAAIVVVEIVLVVAGYPITMEWLTRGARWARSCSGCASCATTVARSVSGRPSRAGWPA